MNCEPHHWLIEPPQGPVSMGTCKHCNEEREFRNSPQETTNWRKVIQGKSGQGHGLTKTQLNARLKAEGRAVTPGSLGKGKAL